MSDERQSSLVPLFAHLLSSGLPPPSSLKRKLGQTIPIPRSSPTAYPSPPMSNPPSPSRQPPRTFTSTVSESPATTAEPTLAPSSPQQVAIPSASTANESSPSVAFDDGSGNAADTGASLIGLRSSIGPSGSSSSGQNVFSIASMTAATAPSSSQGPVRAGRKAKAHVASACMNCKRAHLSCDAQRPCTRCVTSGKQDTCFDVPHKKRGRPRLREENEFKGEHVLPEQVGNSVVSMGTATAGPSTARPIARTRHQRTESLRSLRSQTSDGSSGSSMPTPGFPPVLQPGWVYQPPRPPSSGMLAAMIPTAFLDLDFNFIRANRPFQQIVANDQDIKGRQLQDLAVPADGTNLTALRAQLKGEREAREPAHMPPILQPGEDPIQGVTEDDVDRLATGFSDQTYTWTRAGSGLQRETFPARMRLAKASAYFVVVTLPSFRPVEMLPPQAATSAHGYIIPPPPAPILSSQPSKTRLQVHSSPPSPYPSHGMTPSTQYPFISPEQSIHPRAYPSIQAYPPQTQPFATAQRPTAPSTPRLPTAEPPMQITPMTPLTTAPRPAQHPGTVQLPPLTATPSAHARMPLASGSNAPEAQQAPSDDEEESPKKRRRMDISDVLHR